MFFTTFSLRLPSFKIYSSGFANSDCTGNPTELIYFSDYEGNCAGRWKTTCGDGDVSINRFDDPEFKCAGEPSPSFPLTFTSACTYENSLGFARYGYATCTKPEDFEVKTSWLDLANNSGAKSSEKHELWKPLEDGEAMISPREANPETAPAVPEEEERQ